LDRYLHYYQRFHAHGQAQKFAKKQLAQTEQRMVQLQDGNSDTSWIDVQFLKTATEQLIECRRVLKYTYTFAYYLEDKDGIKERFEHHQEMLEKVSVCLN
jgi:ariadne-1